MKKCFCCLVDLSACINSSQNAEEIITAGQSGNEYLQLAKKGGGHKGKRWKLCSKYFLSFSLCNLYMEVLFIEQVDNSQIIKLRF